MTSSSLLTLRVALQRHLVRRFASEAGSRAGGGAEGGANLKGARPVLTGERGINKVTLLGRAGQDSQSRGSTDNPVTIFPLATSYTLRTTEGEFVQKTEWHRITVFRPVLKDIVSQSVKKGDRVYVQGSISYTQYKDKNDVMQRVTSIIAEDVLNLSRSMQSTASAEPLRYNAEDDEEVSRAADSYKNK